MSVCVAEVHPVHCAFALETISNKVFRAGAGPNARSCHVALGKLVAATIFLRKNGQLITAG